MKKIIKYKRSAAAITLLCYFFLFFYNAAHYHPVSLLQKSEIKSSGAESSSADDIFYLNYFNCQININYKNAHNLKLNDSVLFTAEIEESYFAGGEFTSAAKKILYISHNLRAPPSFV
jgi:hypothetical protein